MTHDDSLPAVCTWLAEPPTLAVSRSIRKLRQLDDAAHIAVMPDVHLSGDVCVGVALATRELIFPAAVGNDIGCGMAAVRLESDTGLLSNERDALHALTALRASVPALKHPSRRASLPTELLDAPLSDVRLEKLKKREGRIQFGTLGRGNHFLEFQADEQERLWLMVHSGSRAMGQAVTAHHRARGCKRGSLVALEAHSSWGQAYLYDLQWAIEYARCNRLAILHATEQIMKQQFRVACDWTTLIHANHNHVQLETHFGRPLWVHRKGALPAAEGQPGVIPGSMGTASFHVTGRGCAQALHSSSHGAGRALARGEALRKINSRQLSQQMRHVWYDQRLSSQLRDEAPAAYKDIRRVMRAQRELTRITRELRPLLCYKGA